MMTNLISRGQVQSVDDCDDTFQREELDVHLGLVILVNQITGFRLNWLISPWALRAPHLARENREHNIHAGWRHNQDGVCLQRIRGVRREIIDLYIGSGGVGGGRETRKSLTNCLCLHTVLIYMYIDTHTHTYIYIYKSLCV